jgi:hypothetical protein
MEPNSGNGNRRTTRRLEALGRRLVLCYLVGACTTWRTIPPAALQPSISSAKYDHVRVIRRDSSRIELKQVRIDPDSVTGSGSNGGVGRVSIAVGEVARIESLEPDVGRTLLLMGVVTAAVIGLAAWIAGLGGCRFPVGPEVRCS